MCGISGIVSSEDIAKDLLNSIRNLEYRGYDSCGMAVFHDNDIEIKKNIGTVDEVESKEHLGNLKGTIGIAHTRWATHGGVTKENSHPHASMNQEFAIVHNGIFSNYQELKSELAEEGISFRSMTDSEVFAHLVERSYEETSDVEEAFLMALSKVEGSFATAMLSIHDDTHLYCAKKDSPLILGIGDGRNFIGSDINGFLEHTKKAITLDDGDYAILNKDNFWIKNTKSRTQVNKKSFTIDWDVEASKKGGFSHYMLKEIFDQPYTVQQALEIDKQDIHHVAKMMLNSRYNYLVGVGTTYYVAMFAQYLFSNISKKLTPILSSDEFCDSAVLSEEDMVLTMSQSGETYDTKLAVKLAKKHQAKTAAIVNVMGSSICMMVDKVIMQGSGAEICVVSTKAALSQMIILLRIVLESARLENRMSDVELDSCYKVLNELPLIIENTLNEQSGFVRNLAKKSSHIHNWMFLGCGIYYPIAMESALKMKEVTYIHAEGLPAGFLKHGTLAMIDSNLFSLFFVPPPEVKILHTRTLVAIEEVKARGGTVYGFGFINDDKANQLLDQMIQLPIVSPLIAPFLEMIMAQLFAYYTALDLGRNIDKPRNLAKSVTVA